MEQYRLLEAAELGSGLDAEVVPEEAPCPLVGGECIALSPDPVQGRHHRRPRCLTVGMLLEEGFELGNRLGLPAHLEEPPGSLLSCQAPELTQPAYVRLRELLVCDVVIRSASPQIECLLEVP